MEQSIQEYGDYKPKDNVNLMVLLVGNGLLLGNS